LRRIELTAVGPTFAPRELAVRKLLAVFGRAEARDFADLFTLAAQFDVAELLNLAPQIDGGFNLGVFVEMLGNVHRFGDDELAATGADPAALRSFVSQVIDRLR
jgi:hypothetical protein